ncbi:acyl-CoA reductase [Azospirillum brasilense]|uniref:acyl-CoA reductase n=1 Tax=Azospirillum brasilense TaxID=192 RepID=UPI001EDA6E6D|nr:acyl-CoA reductase [Azospirillum brasilense]UKJ74927.1 acyl-CoA reductase [Azospirillum brasilense]
MERAGHLPGLSADAVGWRTLTFRRGAETLDVAVPVLAEAQIAELATRVRTNARTYLRSRTVAEIAATIDRAVARLLDRDDPWRQKAERLLPLVTGYDAEMVRLGLTGYLKTFRGPELRKFIAEDFANPAVLDDFQPMPKGGFARAFGPELLLHVWAGNVPGLPLWSLISGLLVKAGTVGKLPSAEPLFAGWFAQILAEIDPELADCIAIVWWKGGDEVAERAWLGRADTVVAYGGNDALEAIRARVPITTRFLPYGHKISFGMVSRSALDAGKAGAVARQAAYDVARYDQQGCYSPQTFFVERGGRVSPRAFAGYLAHELDALGGKFPRRPLSMGEAGSVASWRNAEETKGFADPSRALLGDPAGSWAVAYTDAADGLSPCGLNRTVTVGAVGRLADAVPGLAPYRAFLQTVGIAAAPEELFALAGALGAVGVTRLCALGRMTAPEAGWHHDGRFNLLDLVTMTEIEGSAERAADIFAPYTD